MESGGPGEDTVELVEHAIFQLGWLGQRHFMQLLMAEQFELTIPQYHTLAHLARCGMQCKMSDLAKATHQSAASLTGVVDRLLEKQLVERGRQAHDRRQVMVEITEPGSRVLVAIKHARRDAMQAALREMDQPTQQELVRLLQIVAASMARQVAPQHGNDSD